MYHCGQCELLTILVLDSGHRGCCDQDGPKAATSLVEFSHLEKWFRAKNHREEREIGSSGNQTDSLGSKISAEWTVYLLCSILLSLFNYVTAVLKD